MGFLSVSFALLNAVCAHAAVVKRQATASSSTSHTSASPTLTPDCFDAVSEGPYPGPTQTGQVPFLTQIDPVAGTGGLPTGTASYVPNAPLETSEAIPNNTNINIFQYMGNLSPYFPNPVGFGADEHSVPSNCNITMVNVLHRHGSRYPITGANVFSFAQKLQNATGFVASGELS